MSLPEELSYIQHNLPEAWTYFRELIDAAEARGRAEAMTAELPKFDDNDEMIEEDD